MNTEYEQYSSTGVPWIGEVPNHWGMERAKWLYQKMDRPVRDTDEVVTCFRDGFVTLRKNRRLDGFTNSIKEIGYQGVRRGDLVIHAMDAFAGAAGVSDSDGKSTPVYSTCTARRELDNRYYAYLVREMARSQWIMCLARGIRERSTDFRFQAFGAQPVPLPPVEEQRAIADYLDANAVKLRHFIRNRRRLIEVLNEQKQRLTQSATTSSSTKLHRMRDLVTNPKRKVERVENQEYRPIGLYNWGRGIFHKPTTRGQDLGDSVFFWVEEGDLVFSGQFAWEGAVSLARRKDHRCIASHRYPIFISKTTSVRTSYLESFFQSSAGQSLMEVNSRGAAGRNRPLNTRSLLREMIPVPSIDEQLKIEEFSNHLQRISDVFGRQINLIREYRTRLISDVVTGKVDVRHLAPPPGSGDLEEWAEVLEPLEEDIADAVIDDEEPVNEPD